VGFIPVVLAWFVGRGLFLLVRRVKSGPTTSVDRVAAKEEEALQTAVTATKTRAVELVLLDFVLPNGRKLRDCTFSELRRCGGWLTRLARVGQPSDNVGTTLTEKEVRAVWSET
jgi:hypothetical protein